MKIGPNLTASVSEATLGARPGAEPAPSAGSLGSGPAARLSVSDDARFVNEARVGAKVVPMRLDLVEAMRRALADGSLLTEANLDLATDALLGDL